LDGSVLCVRPAGSRETADLRQIAVKDIAADPNRKMPDAAESRASAERGISADEGEAELRCEELEYVHGHLAGVLRRARTVRNHDRANRAARSVGARVGLRACIGIGQHQESRRNHQLLLHCHLLSDVDLPGSAHNAPDRESL
jgi:hypothetical protein